MHGSTCPMEYSVYLFYLSYWHCCQVNENASEFKNCSIYSMTRIPNDLRERAIGMLDTGMSIEHVARQFGCSSRAIRNLRLRFRTTCHVVDVRVLQGVVKNAISWTRICAIDSKLPLLPLLTHLGFIITESVHIVIIVLIGHVYTFIG